MITQAFGEKVFFAFEGFKLISSKMDNKKFNGFIHDMNGIQNI